MAESVRWGVLSAAKIAKEWLCPAIHNCTDGHLAAIASRTPGKAADLAKPYRGVKLFDDYDALLTSSDIDAVYIPLPNAAHVEWTNRALDAGKHVLCEKPIALKAEEIDGLISARDRSGLLAAEAFMVVHHPQWKRIRELLSEGVIGDLRHVQGAFSFFNDDLKNIRNDASQGGGALRDIGVYPSVTTRFATGEEPKKARSKITWDNGIDATARVWAEFPSFSLDFYVSMRMHPRQEMVFHGSNGWIKVLTPFNAKLYGDDVLEIRDQTGSIRLERFPMVDQYVQQINAFNSSILNSSDYPCTLEFSRGNQVMIDMIYAGEVD